MKFWILATLFTMTAAMPAFAADSMGGKETVGMKMLERSSAATKLTDLKLTDAVVKRVDAGNGMITLQHGPLDNVGMPPMTMAFKAKDAAMAQQATEGDKVRVRIENVKGTLTIVRMEKYGTR